MPNPRLNPRLNQRLNQRFCRGLVMGSLLLAALRPALNVPARAQSAVNPSVRAANLARMTAERLNGGLGVYRAAPCMHEQSGGACLAKISSEGLTFRFMGGVPGWPQLNLPPSVETEILVSSDGRTVLQVIYNGPVRQVVNMP